MLKRQRVIANVQILQILSKVFLLELRHNCFKLWITHSQEEVCSLLSAAYSTPFGFLSPFTVSGRMLLRKACPEGIDWDETLPDIHKDSWQTWTQNSNLLNGYQIPRMYAPTSLSLSKNHAVLISCYR
jgi:hypothetical protein